MSNSLMTAGGGDLLAKAGFTGKISLNQKEAEDSSGVKASRYFPYIQLMQTSNKKKLNEGLFVLTTGSKDPDPTTLGLEFDAIPITIRGKAAYWPDPSTCLAEYETIIGGLRVKTDNYDEYIEKAKESSLFSNKWKSGLDVLLWVPGPGCFAVYGAQSPKAVQAVERNIAPYLTDFSNPIPHTPSKISSDPDGNAKGSWVAISCTPIVDFSDWEAIDEQMLVDAITLFNCPAQKEEAPPGAEVVKEDKRSR